MRIACIHVPQLSLQCATRIDPALRGAAIAVVGVRPDAGKAQVPQVLACSRAAFLLGVRVGMSVPAARAEDVQIIHADPQSERETVRALADSLLALTPVIDVGGRIGAGGAHLAMYCEVPSKTRGSSFGDRVVRQLEALGITGRIGIADDRFTAWVAASVGTPSHDPSASARPHPSTLATLPALGDSPRLGGPDEGNVVSVPRGGSAPFLAPRPLSLLAISTEVQHMLEALGVTTLGEFAALPAPSVARPFEADFQALARGEGGQTLRPYAPEAPIREELVVRPMKAGTAHPNGLSLAAAVGQLAERVSLRLAGRARGAARLELAITGPAGERTVPIVPIASARARTSLEAMLVPVGSEQKLISSSEAIADAITTALGGDDSVWRLRLTVIGEAIAGDDVASELSEAEAPGIVDTLSVVLSTTGGSLDLAFGPLSLTPGPTAGVLRERREAHQRTRRTKRHRSRPNSVIQPKLFKG